MAENAKVEWRHVEAAKGMDRYGCYSLWEIEQFAQILANTEAAATSAERKACFDLVRYYHDVALGDPAQERICTMIAEAILKRNDGPTVLADLLTQTRADERQRVVEACCADSRRLDEMARNGWYLSGNVDWKWEVCESLGHVVARGDSFREAIDVAIRRALGEEGEG